MLVITGVGVDNLHMSLNHLNDPSAWARGVSWTLVPFDAVSDAPPSTLAIADVYIMDISPTTGSALPNQNCFVDSLRQPGDPLQLLDRYYIQTTSAPQG